jgi:hypothetical protein
MSNVAINIAAEFTGKKAFKQAETSTDRLTKSTKQLAKGLLAVYSTQKIMAFAKSSVKAFAEDDKAAKALGTTLKNLGLAYGSNAATVNGFISRLEMQTGVLDDELRPAMDRLLRATGDVTKSQELLGLALDIAAGTGKSLTQVSQSLQKAYLGQTQALGRLGVGLSKAELTSSSFEEIQARLSTLFAGQATAAADTYAGSLAKLTVAGNNAKETIGKGLVDALVTASNSTSTDDLIKKIDRVAQSIANFTREAGEFIKITKTIFDFKNFSLFAPSGGLFGDGKGFGNISMTVSSQDTQRADAIAKKNAMSLAKLSGVQASNQAKILKDKRLAAAIDKANLALNKGSEVFDMDKIQIAAALTNQAEQLGKATSASQVLQIANDTARLNVKKSILALEDAIAAKDEAAIIAATAKLNADLKVLGALGLQNVKLQDIKSILDTLKPKDLINISNLEEALRLLGQINLASTGSKKVPTSASLGSGIPAGDYIAPISTVGGSIEAILEYADAAAARANAFADLLDMENASAASQMASTLDLESIARSSLLQGLAGGAGVSGAVSGSRYAAQAANQYNITVQTGIGDPNAIAEAIDQVLIDAVNRGTLRGGYTIA